MTETDKSLLSRIKCQSCNAEECKNCKIMSNPLNTTLSNEFHKLWRNINLVKNGNQYAVLVGYMYKTNPYITFAPKNSNFNRIKDKTKLMMR